MDIINVLFYPLIIGALWVIGFTLINHYGFKAIGKWVQKNPKISPLKKLLILLPIYLIFIGVSFYLLFYFMNMF